MAKAKTQTLLEVPCAYGDVGVGETVARLSVHVDRKRLSLAQADRLVGKRLVGRITYDAGNDNPEQDALPGAEATTELEGAFDVKRFGFNKKSISTTLSFSIASIDLPTLCGFAKRAGTLYVSEIADIPEDEAADE